MSESTHIHRVGLRDSASTGRRPLGAQVIRKRVDGPSPAIPFSVFVDQPVSSSSQTSSSSTFSRKSAAENSKQSNNERRDVHSSVERNISKGERVRASHRTHPSSGERLENFGPIATSSFAKTESRSSKEPAPSSQQHEKTTRKSGNSSREPSDENIGPSVSKHNRQHTQHAFKGPSAASEFERLRKEVEMLKEALHESKKSAKRYHKKLEESRTELSTALTVIGEKDLELSSLKAKQMKSQEILTMIEVTIQCQICFDLPERPYALAPCGHVLCLACLQEWFRNAPANLDDFDDYDDPEDILCRAKTCPACRTIVRHRPAPMFMIKGISTALGNINLTPAPPPESIIAIDAADDPWEGIFPSSSSEDGRSQGSYDTDDNDSDDIVDPGLRTWLYPLDEVGRDSDEVMDEFSDEEDESVEEEGDSSSEEWGPRVYAVSVR